MVYINPKWIFVEFLRKNLTDPRTSRIATEKVITITATTGQTDCNLSYSTNKGLSYIEEVTIDDVAQKKWKDYYIDFRNNKIVFFNSLTEDEVVIITLYETVSDWIYWDWLNGNLTPNNFPRVTVTTVTGLGRRLGNYKAPVESIFNFQIDIYAKEKSKSQIFDIDNNKYTGEALAEIIAYNIQAVLEDNEEDLYPAFYDYDPVQLPPKEMEFDTELQCHRKMLECGFKAIKIGRVE